jgi:hypothetical protein
MTNAGEDLDVLKGDRLAAKMETAWKLTREWKVRETRWPGEGRFAVVLSHEVDQELGRGFYGARGVGSSLRMVQKGLETGDSVPCGREILLSVLRRKGWRGECEGIPEVEAGLSWSTTSFALKGDAVRDTAPGVGSRTGRSGCGLPW